MSNNTPELSDVLLYDPGYLNPELPTGFWFCADRRTCWPSRSTPGCLRASAGWGGIEPPRAVFPPICYVLVVCGDPEKRAVMVRELRQRLPMSSCWPWRTRASAGATPCGTSGPPADCGRWSGCSWKRWRSQPTASWTWRT